MEAHPAAELFPMIQGEELRELVSDIADHGLLAPIVVHEGKILDGRNRYRACEVAGVEPQYVEWQQGGATPTEYVLSANIFRRHLSVSERATIAVEALPLLEEEARTRSNANLRHSSMSPIGAVDGRATEIAAKQVGVGARTVQRAKKLKEDAPEIFEEVKAGKMTVAAGTRTAEKEAPSKSNRRRINEAAAMRKVYDAFGTLDGWMRGIESFNLSRAISSASSDDLKAWDRSAANAISTLKNFRQALKETSDNG